MTQTKATLDRFHHISVTHVKGQVAPSFFAGDPHSHDHCEIFVHLAGRMDVFVEQNQYSLWGGEIRLYRSGELHCGRTDHPQEMEWYQISIPHEFFLGEAGAPLSPILFTREAGTENVFYSGACEEITSLLSEVFASRTDGNPRWATYAESAVLRILCLLNETRLNRAVSIRRNRALEQLLGVINASFGRLSTVEDLCALTHYSPSYVNRVFKTHMGITPYRFLLAKKLNEAKKALLAGCSVTEACEYAGFNSYNNFITLFRKTFRAPPGQYRGKRTAIPAESRAGKEPT